MRFSLKAFFLSAAVVAGSSNSIQAQDFTNPVQKFADETYDASYAKFQNLKSRCNKKPILATLGLEQYDIPHSAMGVAAASDEEPAIQGLYIATSWLLAAKNTMGDDKVVLAVGLNQRTIDEYNEKLQCNNLNSRDVTSPFPYILKFARDHKIETVSIDVCDDEHRILDRTSEQCKKMRGELKTVVESHPGHAVVAVVDANKETYFLGFDNGASHLAESEIMREFPSSEHAVAAQWGTQFEIPAMKGAVSFQDRLKGPLTGTKLESAQRVEQFDAVQEARIVPQFNVPTYAEREAGDRMIEFVEKSAETYPKREAERQKWSFEIR